MAGWWPGCPQGGRLGSSAAVSAGCILGLLMFFHLALPVSFGGSGSQESCRQRVRVFPYPVWPLFGREMPLEDGDPARWRGQQVNGEVSSTPRHGGMGDTLPQRTPAPNGSRMDVMAEGSEPGPVLGDGDVTPGGAPQPAGQEPGQREEALMAELSELVQKVVKSSSWWERHGVDISILACSFLLLPAGNPAQHPQTRAGGSLGVSPPPQSC